MPDTPDSSSEFEKLFNVLSQGTNDLELRHICRAVRVAYKSLAGSSHFERCQSLMDQLEEQNRLPDLERELRQRRPKRFSPAETTKEQAPYSFNLHPKGLDKLHRPTDKRKFAPQEKFKLIDKLLECDVIKKRKSRETLVRQLLSPEVSAIIDDPNDRIHITNLVDKCLNYLWGLEQLIEVVRYYEGESPPVLALEALIQETYPRSIQLSQLRTLKHLLEEVPCPVEILTQLYIKAYAESVVDGWLPSDEHNEYEKRAFILDCLAVAPERGGKLPIILFIEYLIAYLEGKLSKAGLQMQDKLRSWVSTNTGEHSLERATTLNLHAPDRSDSPKYLLVTFRTNSDEISFFVQAWLMDSNYRVIAYLDVNDAPVEGKDIPNLISHLLKKSYEHLTGEDLDHLIIELSLPKTLLFGDIDHWPIKIGTGKPVKIGIQHQVVVRAYDRIAEKLSPQFWKRRGESLSQIQKSRKPLTPLVFCDPEDCDSHESIYAKIRYTHIACLVLTFALTEDEPKNVDIIDTILDAGIPIALWSRQDTLEPKHLKTMFETLLTQCNLSELPKMVWDQRIEAFGNRDEKHLGYRLTLLLDDPGRLPPDEQQPSDTQYYLDTPK